MERGGAEGIKKEKEGRGRGRNRGIRRRFIFIFTKQPSSFRLHLLSPFDRLVIPSQILSNTFFSLVLSYFYRLISPVQRVNHPRCRINQACSPSSWYRVLQISNSQTPKIIIFADARSPKPPKLRSSFLANNVVARNECYPVALEI